MLISVQFIYYLRAWTSLFFFFFNVCKRITPLSIPNLSFLVLGDEVFYFLLLKIHLSAIQFAVLIKSFGGMGALN